MVDAGNCMLAEPIVQRAYEPYGSLISADSAQSFVFANMKTARRFNNLCDVENRRQGGAELNLCIFRCSPVETFPLPIKFLERHEHSTQVFLPISNDATYLVVVCLGEDKPDLSTFKVFKAGNSQGISYKPGVWHYPMTVVGNEVDFACLVFEDGSSNDCEVKALERTIQIDL